MSGKNSNWLSDIKQCIHYKEPGLDCTLLMPMEYLDTELKGGTPSLSSKNTFRIGNIDLEDTFYIQKVPTYLYVNIKPSM